MHSPAVQTGLKPALQALGLGDGGVLILRKPAQPPPAGAVRALPEVEVAMGAATPEVQHKYEQRRQQAVQQVLERRFMQQGCCLFEPNKWVAAD